MSEEDTVSDVCTEDEYSEMAETCYSKCSVKVTKTEEDRTKIEGKHVYTACFTCVQLAGFIQRFGNVKFVESKKKVNRKCNQNCLNTAKN